MRGEVLRVADADRCCSYGGRLPREVARDMVCLACGPPRAGLTVQRLVDGASFCYSTRDGPINPRPEFTGYVDEARLGSVPELKEELCGLVDELELQVAWAWTLRLGSPRPLQLQASAMKLLLRVAGAAKGMHWDSETAGWDARAVMHLRRSPSVPGGVFFGRAEPREVFFLALPSGWAYVAAKRLLAPAQDARSTAAWLHGVPPAEGLELALVFNLGVVAERKPAAERWHAGGGGLLQNSAGYLHEGQDDFGFRSFELPPLTAGGEWQMLTVRVSPTWNPLYSPTASPDDDRSSHGRATAAGQAEAKRLRNGALTAGQQDLLDRNARARAAGVAARNEAGQTRHCAHCRKDVPVEMMGWHGEKYSCYCINCTNLLSHESKARRRA